jgi:hypothetical protein
MGEERLKSLLAELHEELHQVGEIDPDTRKVLSELNADIEEVASVSAAERARELESRFAAEHPVLERIAREMADLLTKMGI